MKQHLIALLLVVYSLPAFGQKVDSIRVEQTGDFIRISYKLLQSTPGEIYRVRALCSINGGPNIELRSVSGDTGDNVQGGKAEYFIVWDVLKDIEELKSAEFIIRAELVQNLGKKATAAGSKRGSFMPVFQLPGPGFGLRLSYLGKAGFSFQYVNSKSAYTGSYTDREATRLHRISLGPTFRLLNTKTDQMHLFVGPAIGQNWIVEEYVSVTGPGRDYNLHFSPGLEGSLILCQKSTLFMIGVQKLLPEVTEEGKAITKTLMINAGFGIRF